MRYDMIQVWNTIDLAAHLLDNGRRNAVLLLCYDDDDDDDGSGGGGVEHLVAAVYWT